MFSLIIHVTSTQIYILERLRFLSFYRKIRSIKRNHHRYRCLKKKGIFYWLFSLYFGSLSRINVGTYKRVIALTILHLISFIFDSKVGRPVASKAKHPVRLMIKMEKFDKNLGLFLCCYRVTYPFISVLSHHWIRIEYSNISRVVKPLNDYSLRNAKKITRTFWEKHFFHRGPIDILSSNKISDQNFFFLISLSFITMQRIRVWLSKIVIIARYRL